MSAPAVSGRWVRVVTVGAVLLVAAVAAVVSYAHMAELGRRAGEGWRALLLPLSVDGLVVAASMVLLTSRRAGLPGGRLAWCALLGGVGASLAANVAAAEPTTTARLVAAWPALAFAVAFELLLQQRRVPGGELAAEDPPASRGATPMLAPPTVRPDPATRTGPPVRPVPTSADRSDRSPPRTGPARQRPAKARSDAQLSQAVRELAAQTGAAPSQYQIKARFGVGSGRAARLLAELGDLTPPGPPQSNAESNGAPTRKEGA